MNGGLDEVRRDWETLGSEDPLWAVLMKPGTRHGRWDVDEFLATGRDEVDAALSHLSHLTTIGPLQRVLDFGCGAGRLSQALARHASEVIGLDVSAPMLDTARRIDRSNGRCRFEINQHDDLSDFDDDAFDLVYSSLVLQHLPPAAAERFLAEFARVTKPGGAIIIQVASVPLRNPKGLLFRYAPRRLLRFGQTKVLGYPAPMRMEPISAEKIAEMWASWSVEVLDRSADETYGGHWTYHRYFAVKRLVA